MSIDQGDELEPEAPLLYRLASGTRLTPVSAYPEAQRTAVGAESDDCILSRPGARDGDQLIDADLARMLRRFEHPTSVAEAVARSAEETKEHPDEILEAVFPTLDALVRKGFLTREAGPTVPPGQLAPGSLFADRYEILDCLMRLEDTEIHVVRDTDDPNGLEFVLKLAHRATRRMVAQIEREALILRHLDGLPSAPPYLAHGEHEGRPFLVMGRVRGRNPQALSDDLRRNLNAGALVDIVLSLLDAFLSVQARGILHGDVHPGNVLVTDDGRVVLLDFGQARTLEGTLSRHATPRGAVNQYYEPEMASALVAGTPPPPATEAGQQFALAAMIYRIITGGDHVALPAHRDELFPALASQIPRPFPDGLPKRLVAVEPVLIRALGVDPVLRYPSLTAFRDAIRDTLSVPEPALRAPLRPDAVQRLLSRFERADDRLTAGNFFDPLCSLKFGAAGLSYALMRLADHGAGPRALALAGSWLHLGERLSDRPESFHGMNDEISVESVGRVTPFHTASGLSYVAACLAAARGDGERYASAIDRFTARIDHPCTEWDLSLGWAGVTLMLALMLRAGTEARIEPSTLDRVRALLAERRSRQIEWLDSVANPAEVSPNTFLGIAHGQAGQIYAVLSADHVLGLPTDERILARLDALADCAVPVVDGLCWPRTGGRFHAGFGLHAFPGWCNGTAGHAMLFALAARVTDKDAYVRIAEGAARHAHAAEVPYHDLCCGAAGVAYAQLSLFRLTGSEAWWNRATDAAAAARHHAATLRRSCALYKGDLGLDLLDVELAGPEVARMPCFELI